MLWLRMCLVFSGSVLTWLLSMQIKTERDHLFEVDFDMKRDQKKSMYEVCGLEKNGMTCFA